MSVPFSVRRSFSLSLFPLVPVSVFLSESVSLCAHLWDVSLRLCLSLGLSVPCLCRLQSLSFPAVLPSLPVWLCLFWSPSLSLPPSLLPSPLLFLSEQEEACKGLRFPSRPPPHPLSLPRFFLYSLFKTDKVHTAAPS